MKMNHKTMLYVGAGVVVLYLIYRYYENNIAGGGSSTPATSTGATTDQGSADYAALAGQEQADIAGVSGQEASDVGNLTSQIGGLSGTLAGLQGTVAGLATPVAGPAGAPGAAGAPGVSSKQLGKLTTEVGALHKEMVKLAAGQRRTAVRPHVAAKKAGTGKKASSSPHANANHPTGTAGHAIARPSHNPRRRGGGEPVA